MTAFCWIFAVTIKKIPLGLAKLVGWTLGASGGHLCSHEEKVSEANMGWHKQQDGETQTPNDSVWEPRSCHA